MTGNELIEFIQKNNLGDVPVAVGCQGYTNIEDEDNETRVESVVGLIGDIVLIHDACGCYTEDI